MTLNNWVTCWYIKKQDYENKKIVELFFLRRITLVLISNIALLKVCSWLLTFCNAHSFLIVNT